MTENELDGLLRGMRTSVPTLTFPAGESSTYFFGTAQTKPGSAMLRRCLPYAVAASLLIAVLFWHNASVVAERRKLEEAERIAREANLRAAEANRGLAALRQAGYLDAICWHGWLDPKQQPSPFLIAGTHELIVSGLVRPRVIERIEVSWDDQPNSPPETIYPRGPLPESDGPVTFVAHKRYELDGRVVRPRFRVVPFKSAERALNELGFTDEKRSGEGVFRCTPLGLVVDSELVSPFYETAIFVLRNHGDLRLFTSSKKIRKVDDLPRPMQPIQQISLANQRINDSDVERVLRGAVGLQGLHLSSTAISDDALTAIGETQTLRWLFLSNTKITDRGLSRLSKMKNLLQLDLSTNQITDVGVRHLGSLQTLTWLGLSSTEVSDASLETLKSLKNLKALTLVNTRVSDQGVKQLHQALPGCKIER